MFKRRAFYRVTIELDYEARKAGRKLSLKDDRDYNIDLVKEVQNIILQELPMELEKAYGMFVKTKITHVTEGSIIVVFSAIFGFGLGLYQFIANYPDFKDGSLLLKEDLNRLLDKMLNRYAHDLNASVDLVSPRIEKHHHKLLDEMMVVRNGSNYFFPFLLSVLLNIGLIGCILLLIWKAVQKVYF